MDVHEKKDFDLEVVLSGLEACRQADDTLILKEYLNQFHELCRFFKLAGHIFGFVAKDLEAKIASLEHHLASPVGDKYRTIQSMLQYETDLDLVKVGGRHPSGSRSLLRLHRAMEFINGFMRRIVHSDDHARSSHLAMEVYGQTLAKHHPYFVRKLASLAVLSLPNRRTLIETMCKHEMSEALELVDKVVDASEPVYSIVQGLYEKNDLLKI